MPNSGTKVSESGMVRFVVLASVDLGIRLRCLFRGVTFPFQGKVFVGTRLPN